MSFSSEVKDELARQIPRSRHCRIAELASVIRFAGEVDLEEPEIVIRTENVILAKKYYTLIKRTFEGKALLNIRGQTGMGRLRQYNIVIRDEKLAADVAKAVYYGDDEGMECDVLRRDCCQRAFIRGAFLVAGSMSNPGKSYHFEIVCRSPEQAQRLCPQICNFQIAAKIIQRKNRYIVYIKDSEGIVDILNVMEAYQSSMELENVRIIKNMRNSANRQYNCDSANINKMVRAAARQLEEIHLIEEEIGLENLPPALYEMAQVRLEHPEESLQELGSYLNPPVGKSGVNHRLRKLSQIAADIMDRG